ncbi:hypothetical protein SFRURICE_016451 [Spodoptera frugiperda]|nr:hypothetical protein SFRURICE_016451 [Spodoptera frugiperda]
MNAKTLAIIVILLYNVRICQSKKYVNFTLYSTVPTSPEHLKFLQNLDKQKYMEVIFWRKPSMLYEDVQLIVHPGDKEHFLERVYHFKMKVEELLSDVNSAFEAQTVTKYLRLNTDTYTWYNYHKLEDIYQWLADMAVRYPNAMELNSIGKSIEGRDIYVVSVKKPGNKFKVIVEGGIHGDEWIAVELVTYLINELVGKNNSDNRRLYDLSRKYDWYLIPIVNPDGYLYSHTTDRLWRKNRRGTANAIGVDLNRNFDYNFGNFVTEKKQNLRFYFSFHAYGQKLIIPYADRINHIDNYGEMENFGKQAILKMYKMYGTKYAIGTTYDTLGLRISGNSASWVKRIHGVRYVFTFLLRDEGYYGYALPPNQILPTCEETVSGLTELMVAKPRRVRGIPVDDIHLEFFKNLTTVDYVNFWRDPGQKFKPVDFVVDPEHKEQFLKDAENLGLYLTTIIEDVQKAFDMQSVKPYIRRKMDSFDWNNYFRLQDIYEWLQDLEKTYPTEIKLTTIGRSYESREIIAVRIALKGSKMRSKVIVEGGIHAREWIAPAFVTYLINQIIHAPNSNNPELKEIALTYEWYFVPVLNPDGYEYSHTHDRMWRKNRNSLGGVDLNRNFNHAFGSTGVSFTVNSEIFCGTSAFSEPESRAMGTFIESKSQHLEYYLAFHSYGQYMILPYANQRKHTENYKEVYTVGTAYDTVGYLTSGVSGCWVKGKFRVPYVVTFELRDNGHDGFALSQDKIRPTCEETMDGVISLLKPRTRAYSKLEGDYTAAAMSLFILDKIVIVIPARGLNL